MCRRTLLPVGMLVEHGFLRPDDSIGEWTVTHYLLLKGNHSR